MYSDYLMHGEYSFERVVVNSTEPATGNTASRGVRQLCGMSPGHQPHGCGGHRQRCDKRSAMTFSAALRPLTMAPWMEAVSQ